MAVDQNGRHTYNTAVAKFLRGGRTTDPIRGKSKIVNGMEDPSFLAFTFGIEPAFSGLFGIENGPVLHDINANYSVLTYLKNAISPNALDMAGTKTPEPAAVVLGTSNTYEASTAGEMTKSDFRTFKQEYEDMSHFIDGFNEITKNHPYMLQSVEGLQDVYKKYYNINKDAYLGGNDTKVKIKCLESMDLRMSALFDSYFRAVYNHKYRRMNIPRNLLEFNCWILVHDLRNLKINENDKDMFVKGSVTKDIASNLSTIMFRFKNCFFDIEEIGAMLSTMSNAEATQTQFEFTFHYTDIDIWTNSLADMLEDTSGDEKQNIRSKYGANYDRLDIVSLNDEDSHTPVKAFDEKLYEESLNLTGLLKNIGSGIFNYATSGSILGNAYDESWAGILSSMMSSISTGGVRGILNNALGRARTEISNAIHDDKKEIDYANGGVRQVRTDRRPDENVYDHTTTQHESITNENVYDGQQQHQPFVQEQIDMDTNATHEALDQENVDMGTNVSAGEFASGNVYDSFNDSHEEISRESIVMNARRPEHLRVVNIYDGNYSGVRHFDSNEKIDMNTNGVHEALEEEKVFDDVKQSKETYDLGNAYTITQETVSFIPVNVYDRISEAKKGNDIPIEKIYMKPVRTEKLNPEFVEKPVRETKASTFEQMNAYTYNAKKQIIGRINGIGNIY